MLCFRMQAVAPGLPLSPLDLQRRGISSAAAEKRTEKKKVEAESTGARERLMAMQSAPRRLSDFDFFVFDCDDTLYRESTGVRDLIRSQIIQWIMANCNMDETAATAYRDQLFKSYGTTLEGLLADRREVDPKSYWASIHRNTDTLLEPDARLRHCLSQITGGKKYVFSNGDSGHVRRCLRKLDIADQFDLPIFDIEYLSMKNKPAKEAYEQLKNEVGIVDGARCIFFDDSLRNLQAAKPYGWTTVLIDEKGTLLVSDNDRNQSPVADYVASDVATGLLEIFPQDLLPFMA